MNTEKMNKVLYMIIVILATVSMIPGFIVGSLLYLLGAMILSLIGKDAIQDYIAVYVFGIKEFIEHYKKNFWIAI